MNGNNKFLDPFIDLAKSKDWLFFKTSAKNGVGVEDLFTGLILKVFNLPTVELQGQALRQLYSKRQLSIPQFDSNRGLLSREDSRNDTLDGDRFEFSRTQSPKSKLCPTRCTVLDETLTNKDTKQDSEPNSQQPPKKSVDSIEVSPIKDIRMGQEGLANGNSEGGLLSKIAKFFCG